MALHQTARSIALRSTDTTVSPAAKLTALSARDSILFLVTAVLLSDIVIACDPPRDQHQVTSWRRSRTSESLRDAADPMPDPFPEHVCQQHNGTKNQMSFSLSNIPRPLGTDEGGFTFLQVACHTSTLDMTGVDMLPTGWLEQFSWNIYQSSP